jgi:hypothetical protein
VIYARINRYQYGKLQRAELHESFLSTAKHEVNSAPLILDSSDKISSDSESLKGGSRYPNCSDTETPVYIRAVLVISIKS